ncbi:MAG TPA: hypothetical protein VGL63_14020 [Streptosporangiaceae bacterium]|jgi:hypothetical protein
MVTFTDATSVGVILPIRDAFLLPAAGGRSACAPSTVPGLHTAKGTSVSAVSNKARAEQPVFGPAATHKPNNYMTRVDAIGGGGPGPHPAREPV